MDEKEILDYYATHNIHATQKKFGITYWELRALCDKVGFKKTSEQLKETYRNTRIEKYGSIENFRIVRRNSYERNYFNRWVSKENENEEL